VIDLGFILFLAVCTGIVLALCGLAWLFLGGKYEEDELP
jgi:hypothetical protein